MMTTTYAVTISATPASAYSKAEVKNETTFVAHARVFYDGCRSDDIDIKPGATATSGTGLQRFSILAVGGHRAVVLTK